MSRAIKTVPKYIREATPEKIEKKKKKKKKKKSKKTDDWRGN